MELQDAVADTPEAALVVVPPAEAIALVPGFRFHPTDEELVRYYLTRKVCGKPIRFEAVSETDVYSCEPWKLACYSSLKSRDLEWYFFSAIDKKYGNGSRMNRATGQGYWKATGKDRVVRHKSRTIGMKKTLVFHSGRAPDGKRTNWVMHEYRLIDDELEQAGVVQDAFMLCRIFQKSGYGPTNADRYAPFVEEEWNDDTTLFVPGEDAEDDKANRDDCNELDLDRDKTLLILDQYPFESQSDEYLYKRDISDDVELEHLSKKPEEPYSRANCSEDSTTTSQDHAAITTTNTKNPPKLFGFSLVQSVVEQKESKPSNPNPHPPPPPSCDTSNHVEKSVPLEYSTFVSGLENEIVNVSMERERLKIEVMRAQSMMNMLYSRIEVLAQENEELRIHLSGR